MQFTNGLAIFVFVFAALFQAACVSAAPCHAAAQVRAAGRGEVSTSSLVSGSLPAARPAPMPFLRPGYTKHEAAEERSYDFQNGDAAEDEAPYAQEVLRASAPPPPLMRMVAERRTSRY